MLRHYRLENVSRLSVSEGTRRKCCEQNYLYTGTEIYMVYCSCGVLNFRDKPSKVAATPPSIWATIKPKTLPGAMPVKVSLNERAMVTAGFANDVEGVNQYAALMYAATAKATVFLPSRAQPAITTPNQTKQQTRSTVVPFLRERDARK